jgi:hypothetical protein
MNYAKLLDETIKVACLLLVIIRRRVAILIATDASHVELVS